MTGIKQRCEEQMEELKKDNKSLSEKNKSLKNELDSNSSKNHNRLTELENLLKQTHDEKQYLNTLVKQLEADEQGVGGESRNKRKACEELRQREDPRRKDPGADDI